MTNYITTDTELTSVADAIRAKSGGNASLTFPGGFVSEIGNILTDGGYTDGLIDRTITSISWNGQRIGGFAFAGASSLTTINFPNVTYVAGSAFQNTGITELTEDMFPSLTVINGGDSFWGMTNLTRVFFPTKEIPVTNYRTFRNAYNLKTAVIKSVGPSTFASCSKLTSVDIVDGGMTGGWNFDGCKQLSTIILRKTTIATMGHSAVFSNSSFASDGAGGTIYIPKALYDHLGDGSSLDYKAATNWSTVDGYGTITWAQIEGSIYETQYVDGTPIE